MKQIQKKNNQKNSISKEQSLTSVKKRRTREELANLTKEQRSLIYDRKSNRYKERQREKQKEAIRKEFPFRKDISFYLTIKVAHRNIFPNVIFNNIQASENLAPANGLAKMFESAPMGELLALWKVFSPKYPKGYTETPPNTHKGEMFTLSSSNGWPEPRPPVASGDQAFSNVMSEAEFLEFVEMFGKRDAIDLVESGLVTVELSILRNFMNRDDEAQPTFNSQINKQQNAYTPWKPEQRPVENPTDAFMNMTKNNFMNSPEWAKFEALMGKEDALKWFEAGLKQASQPWD